jgi:hypothetical protein
MRVRKADAKVVRHNRKLAEMPIKLRDAARSPISLQRPTIHLRHGHEGDHRRVANQQFLVNASQTVTVEQVGHNIGVHKNFIQRLATRDRLSRRQRRNSRASHSASFGSGSLNPRICPGFPIRRTPWARTRSAAEGEAKKSAERFEKRSPFRWTTSGSVFCLSDSLAILNIRVTATHSLRVAAQNRRVCRRAG